MGTVHDMKGWIIPDMEYPNTMRDGALDPTHVTWICTDHHIPEDLCITVPEGSKSVSRMDTQGSRLGTPKSIILGPIFGWVPCQKHGSKTEQGAKTLNGNGKVLCTFDFTKTCFSHVMF